jgi:hypothetical protein
MVSPKKAKSNKEMMRSQGRDLAEKDALGYQGAPDGSEGAGAHNPIENIR